RSFYNDLFGVRQTEDDCAAVFLDAVAGRVPEESVPDLEREISLEEVERAMLSLKTGVAPGRDGLPAEWYRTFWPVVGPDLLAVYREAVRCGALPPSALVGYLTLLYKKGDRTELANWRPITLLTVDYKILAKLMVLHLREVMARVVHPDQTCGVPGRMCGMNLALVRDTLAWADQCRVPLALLSLDQEKAFDRGRVSRVIVNGHCSGLIEQRGGVRQGCPLSPLLYVLYLEPLAERLRREPAFQGLHIPGTGGTRAKVSVYADDATLFLGRDEDFRAVSGILEAFSDATGARINRSKSAVLYAGAWAGRLDVPGGFALCQDGLKILGVVFWREDSAQKNWDIALSKLKARAESWCKRDLSLTGRVVAACSDLLAGLNHLALVFPIPFVTGRRLERALFMFIWGGGVSRSPAQRCARSVRKGEGEWRVSPLRPWPHGVTVRKVLDRLCVAGSDPWKGTSPWLLTARGTTRRWPSLFAATPGVWWTAWCWTTGNCIKDGGTAGRHNRARPTPKCQGSSGRLCSPPGWTGPVKTCTGWGL
ncbi:hypothetical protein QTP86_020693, partial [Hemibagrus guttatus]